MWYKNMPTTVEDFKEKEKTWYGFEKALKVLGLDSKKVLARLKKGQPAYDNLKHQRLRYQKAYVEYSSEPNAEVEEEPKPRTVRLKEKPKVILKGRPTKQEQEPTEGNRATSSNPCKELEELVQALKNKEYRTQREKETWEDRVDYLQKREAGWAVRIKGSVGKEIKRNLPTPCPSCSGRRKKATKTIKEIFSGSEKSGWKNPRPWMLRENTEKF